MNRSHRPVGPCVSPLPGSGSGTSLCTLSCLLLAVSYPALAERGIATEAPTTEHVSPPVQVIDFDSVFVYADLYRPEIRLLTESMKRSFCPSEDENVLFDGYVECVVNINYETIKAACEDLKNEAPEIVTELLNINEQLPPVGLSSILSSSVWNGCFFNKATGPRVESVVLTPGNTSGTWNLRSTARHLYRIEGSSGSASLTAFDDRPRTHLSGRVVGECIVPTLFEYDVLVPESGTGVGRCEISENQISIIETYQKNCGGMGGAYCPDRKSPKYGYYRSHFCTELPSLRIGWYGPHLIALKSLDGSVSGILWQSVTGFPIIGR